MIKIEHLVKYYGQNCAVDDISFEVGKGEIVGLLGPNGAGKSTTMNILTGYLSSTSGRAEIDGIDILSDPLEAKKRIGYLPEQPPLYMDMTVGEYLGFVYELKKCRLDRAAHIDEVCDVVKIGDMKKRLIRSLSKGYRQRVGIAQALIGNPGVIIFDEPTVGLDPKQIIEIRGLIRGLGKTHTVILSTHILGEVQAVCDRIVIINKGRIVADTPTENVSGAMKTAKRFRLTAVGPQKDVLSLLRSRPGVTWAECRTERDGDAYVYLFETDGGTDLRKNLFYTFAERSYPIIGLEAVGMSLEDVFLDVVDASDTPKGDTAASAPPRREDSRRAALADRDSAGKDKKQPARGDTERRLAKQLVDDAEKRREEIADPSYRDEL